MTGPIGLHGGGEFYPGDEPFLDALLEAAAIAARQRAGQKAAAAIAATESLAAAGLAEGLALDVSGHWFGEADDQAAEAASPPIRIVILPTAAARGHPDQAASTGRDAFHRRAAADARRVIVEVARVLDTASAADPAEANRLAEADLIYLPGGDPDLIPDTLRGSLALEAILAASSRGAVVAGASAGAMALAEWTWTSGGGIRGLGLVNGLAVVPHYDDVRRTSWQHSLDQLAPGGLGYLGLDERTGVLSTPDGPAGHGWRVTGQGAAYWFGPGATDPVIGRHGDMLPLPS